MTPLQKRLHDEDFEDYDLRLSKRVAACRTLLEGFTRHFESLGFTPATWSPKQYPDLLPCLSLTAIWASFRGRWTMDGNV